MLCGILNEILNVLNEIQTTRENIPLCEKSIARSRAVNDLTHFVISICYRGHSFKPGIQKLENVLHFNFKVLV